MRPLSVRCRIALSTRTGRRAASYVLSVEGRCSYPIDVNCSVAVMDCATIGGLPASITLIQRFIDSTADRKVLLEGCHLSMNVILIPFLEAIYFNFATKSAKPKSPTWRPQSDFMPCRFKSSSCILSYSSVSWCASFQWKSSRCRSILRCLPAKSTRVRSRFFDFFLVRECDRFAGFIALDYA